MNKEEAMKLAPGSIILVEAIAKCVEDNGVVAVSLHGDNRWHNYAFDCVYAKPEMPKYDPRRLFREGDRVRIVEWNGRKPEAEDKVYTVQQNERPGINMVDIGPNDAGGSSFYTVCFLELVIPVEELSPYFIYECQEEGYFDVMKRVGKLHLTRNSIYYKSELNDHAELTREQAKAAAEAECKRLNEEWRKKVGTEVPCS